MPTPAQQPVGLALRSSSPTSPGLTVDLLTDAVDQGYGPVVVTEVSGRSATTTVAAVAARRPGAHVGTAVVPLGSRSLAALAMDAATIAELGAARVLLGVGVSSPGIVQQWHQEAYDPSLETTRARLRALRSLLDGEPRGSFRLGLSGGDRVDVLLGALGPRMIHLAREEAAGAIVHLVPAERIEPTPNGSSTYAIVWLLDEASEPLLRRALVDYSLTLPYGRHLERLGYAGVVKTVRRLAAARRLPDAAAQVPRELLESVSARTDRLDADLAPYRQRGVVPLLLPTVGAADRRGAGTGLPTPAAGSRMPAGRDEAHERARQERS